LSLNNIYDETESNQPN